MINKRLLSFMGDSKKYIFYNVACQWVSLTANIFMMFSITGFLRQLYAGDTTSHSLVKLAMVVVLCIYVRYICTVIQSRMSYLSSESVKKSLREKIYSRMLEIGSSYKEQVRTSEVVQVAVEGVDQLEVYYGTYLPQFFYAMLAPLTLFVVIAAINLPAAVVLLVCVPLIPVSIIVVQRWAKKLLSKYWGKYTDLGDTFLENLQGMTTLKIYNADEMKNRQMNYQAEEFRKITMRVLTMQLNSITIMDLVAYGGAAVGIIIAVIQFMKGNIGLAGCMMIILLSADFFIPMRQLGSFFHIAMNGIAASDKMFRLLDMEIKSDGENISFPEKYDITAENLHFSYTDDREILSGVDMNIPAGAFTAIVGESGCGKSTIASLIMGRNKNYSGSLTIGGVPLSEIKEEEVFKNITYISHNDYIFKGTVRDNLLMADSSADDEKLWSVLEKVNLADFMKSLDGLDTQVKDRGENFSGGQCQRLALARAILHDSPVYIFDEATSNIDVESENIIMSLIYKMAQERTVVLISHRLANVVNADIIYALEKGKVAEKGTHSQLIEKNGVYAALYNAQKSLENWGEGEEQNENKK
ncbi:MAG: ABC transporter ATP-binding protein/permease [Oscillospiraceae bacterium]|nr:ABC transporter ATP-binding protein/permease [Oscillospiraceae bacterium]